MQSKPQAFIPSLSWRSAVPSIKRALVRFAFVGMTPIVAFYLVYRMLGPIEGMIAGTATATVALGIQAIRMRRFDPVGLVPIGAVLIQGFETRLRQSAAGFSTAIRYPPRPHTVYPP